MAITLVEVQDLQGNTVHDFTTPWEGRLRAGGIRGATAAGEPSLIERIGSRGPGAGGKKVGERRLIVDYWVPVDSSHETTLATLEGEYSQHTDGSRSQTFYLILTEDGVQKRGLCTLDRLAPSDQQTGNRRGHYLGMITLLDAVLQSVDTLAPVEVLNSGNTTIAVVNNGTVPSDYAVIALTPTAQKAASDGERWVLYITPIWRNPWPMVGWPMDVTNGGINHSTLIAAGKSVASGNDLELYENGRRVSRWLQGENTASCKIWGNVNTQAGRYWSHRGSTTISSVATTLLVEESLDSMPAVPFYAVLDGAVVKEVVLVTAIDTQTRKLWITRSQRGTTAPATHPAGTLLYWASTVYDVLTGYTSAPAPDYVEDKREPMVARASSTNATHVWAEFQETGNVNDTQRRYPRSASWHTIDWLDRGDDSNRFVGTIPHTSDFDTDVDPADGMVIQYRANGAYTGHPLQSAWEIRTPVGIATVAFSYDISLEAPAAYPYSGGVRREGGLWVRSVDRDGNTTIEEEYENDTGLGTLSGSDTLVFSAAGYGVQFLYMPWARRKRGGIQAQEPVDGHGIRITAVTLTYDTDTLPGWVVTAVADVAAIYQYGRPDAAATLTNTLGDELELRGIYTPLNTVLTIDVLAGTITRAADGLGMGHLRGGQYVRIPPGSTNITIADAGIGTVSSTVTSRSTWN